VLTLRAQEHDAIFAAVSHLPHVVAYALVSALAQRPGARKLFGFSAGGLRDTVRIAGSSPEMWRDICISNREALLDVLDAYIDELELARGAIAAADGNLGRAVRGRATAQWELPRQH
jgi:prephenate dehydrogenase